MTEVLHRARGWHAVWNKRVVPRSTLPGDTPVVIAMLHLLSESGMLQQNALADSQRTAACPRCGRQTAVLWKQPPTVCTGCRVGHLSTGGQFSSAVHEDAAALLNIFLPNTRALFFGGGSIRCQAD